MESKRKQQSQRQKIKLNQKLFYYINILIIVSFPLKIKCFDKEQCSSFILCIIFISLCLGNYSLKKKGYKKINNETIKISTKL